MSLLIWTRAAVTGRLSKEGVRMLVTFYNAMNREFHWKAYDTDNGFEAMRMCHDELNHRPGDEFVITAAWRESELPLTDGGLPEFVGSIETIPPAPLDGDRVEVFTAHGVDLVGVEIDEHDSVTGTTQARHWTQAAAEFMSLTPPSTELVFVVRGDIEPAVTVQEYLAQIGS